MRKIVTRSKARALGENVRGAVVRCAQDGRKGLIKFKKEWLDDYIESISIDATRAAPASRCVMGDRKKKARKVPPSDAWEYLSLS